MRKWLAIFLLALATIVVFSTVTEPRAQAARPEMMQEAELTHWLTTASGIRHNDSCRWFKKSDGRMCRADEGRACKTCGG